MIAYKFNFDKLRFLLPKTHLSPEEFLLFRVARDGYHSYQGLRRMGYSLDEISDLVEQGALEELNVGGRIAISLRNKDKVESNPGYHATLLERLRQGRETQRKDPVKYTKNRRRSLTRGRMVATKPMKRRRKILLNEVVIPNFGIGDGDKKAPERILVAGVVDLLYSRYIDFAQDHYHMASKQNFTANVWRDVIALGITPVSHSDPEFGEFMSEKLKAKFRDDEEYREGVRQRAQHALEVRMRDYENDSGYKKRESESKSKARRKKMDEDPEYREQVMQNLSLGTSSLWKKVRKNPDKYKNLFEKQKKGLDKGREKIMRRTRERRDALYILVLQPEFGGLVDRVGALQVERVILEGHRDMLEYYEGKNLKISLKRDLAALRKERTGNLGTT